MGFVSDSHRARVSVARIVGLSSASLARQLCICNVSRSYLSSFETVIYHNAPHFDELKHSYANNLKGRILCAIFLRFVKYLLRQPNTLVEFFLCPRLITNAVAHNKDSN